MMDTTAQQRVDAVSEDLSDGKRAEQQVQTIIDAIPVLAWCARADGSAEFLNQRWRDFAGMSLDEARNWNWTVALHPEDVDRVTHQWRAIVASAQPGELEARLRRSDGAYRWFLFRAAPSLDDQGRVLNWYGTNTDIEDRKRVEDTLRADEESLRLLIDSMPGLVSTMSAAGEVEFANRRILDYMGLTLEELRDWSAVIHEDDRARVVDGWNRSVQTGEPYEIEQRVRGADGVYRWFQTRAVALRDSAGRIARWCVMLSETDSRRRAEDTLRNSERALRLLFESIPGMIAVTGADGVLEYVNRRLLDYGGMELEEVRNLGWTSVLHPDDVDAALDKWRHCLATAQPMDATFRIRRFDGVYRWFDSRTEPLIDERGRVVRWYGVLWDIEEQVRAKHALQASERELRMLVDSFPGMVGVTGAEGAHEYANQRALDFVGKTSTEMTGWAADIHPDDLPPVLAQWLRSIATGQPLDVTYRLHHCDGAYRWIHSRAEPLFDEHGKILRWYALLVDIDDQRSAEEALRTSQAELAHVTRVTTMGELTASIAHEVNQPLSAVVNNAGACLGLLADSPQFEEIRGALSDIVDDANRASSIVARVRQLVKRAPFESVVLDVRDIVSDVLALARHESVARRVIIRTELSADVPLVSGDRVQLQQVLLNLVVNGMDAMGPVEESKRVLTIRTSGDGADPHEAVVSVRDSGIGLTPEDMSRLFEAFYTTKPQGMGMGLAISRSIVAAHGGRLWAEPNNGPGATFAFSLPASGRA